VIYKATQSCRFQ